MTHYSTVIIGAGLTGLSCAYHLERDYWLLERELGPGGVVRTKTRDGGFLCDGTGHWLHLRDLHMQEFMGRLIQAQVPWSDLQPVQDRPPEKARIPRRTRGQGRWVRGFGPGSLSGGQA